MTAAQRRYIAIEALVGGGISGALSIAFALIVFGAQSAIAIAGNAGLIVDAVPQGFAIAFMATLVPTLLTRRRRTRGAVLPLSGGHRSAPTRPVVRAIGAGVTGAGMTAALTALLLLTGEDRLGLPSVLVGKTIWGLLLGGTVAAIATRAALADR